MKLKNIFEQGQPCNNQSLTFSLAFLYRKHLMSQSCNHNKILDYMSRTGTALYKIKTNVYIITCRTSAWSVHVRHGQHQQTSSRRSQSTCNRADVRNESMRTCTARDIHFLLQLVIAMHKLRVNSPPPLQCSRVLSMMESAHDRPSHMLLHPTKRRFART